MPPKTLLIPSLLDAHWPLLRWAFQSPAWTPVVLEGARADVEDLGLGHTHNDLCYPFVLITGQVLSALHSGKYDPARTGVLISQTGDGCRGSCLIRLLRPVLGRLFPEAAGDQRIMDSISANVSANLLGLGNAATPLGIEAAKGLAKKSPGRASDGLCMLIVCNTASIQLIPTTVAAVRAAEGCAAPFDILPAVWLASGLSVCAGILACKLLSRLWRRFL